MADPETSPPATYDCIVVGAGFSGLAAAKHLREAGLRFLVLEAQDRIGGRTKTIRLPDSDYWDVGGSFLGKGQHLMYALAEEHGLTVFSIPSEGKIVYYSRGKARPYTGLIPPIRPWEVLDFGRFLYKLEKLCESANLEEPWKTPKADQLDSMTVGEWIRKTAWTTTIRNATDIAIQAVFGTAPERVSMLHAMFLFKAAGGVTPTISSVDGLQKDLVVGGSTAILDKIRENLGEDAVRLSEPVTSVTQDDETVELTTPKGTYRARRVIFAVPPPTIPKINFYPLLPIEKRTLLQHMPMGAYAKVFATYKTPFWRARGLRGECTNVSPDAFLSVAFDVTVPSSTEGKMMAFIVGTRALEFALLSEDERKRIALQELNNFLGREALEPLAFKYHALMEDEFSMGCPMATPAPGMWTLYGEWMRRPVGRLHWAGTETATRFYGYMEGAVEAGQRAAKEVVAELK